MKGILSRTRNSVQREREPFNAGPYRPKIASPGRKSRGNGENVPPDGPFSSRGASPMKSNMKGPKSLKESLPSSPALPPKPPRSSPARNLSTLGQLYIGHGHDHGGSIKRKINWDSTTDTSADHSTGLVVVDPSGGDNGVKVIVRVRPMNKKEEAEEATQVVHKMSLTCVAMGDQQFTYDGVAGEESSQQAVFGMVGLPMVENCLAGFNSSIFAYGQTGSGKTHTMWGVMPGSEEFPSNDRGITPRVFERLFACIQQAEINNMDKQLVYQCRCSFLEIYNEQITDLLEPSQKNLMIREDSKTGVYVDSLSEEYVSNVEDVTRLLNKGLANRRVGVTAMNNESSRSHSVFTCVIESRFKSAGEGVSSVRSSRLNLVDLAGSERQKQTGSAGERLKEAGNINRSLSQLGNVINLLAEVAQSGKQRHIPYRDSRLTFLLQESLGGNAKLAMICAVSPASSCRNETLSTLRFAQRAKAIQNKAVINEEEANDVNLLREQIRQLKDELTRMKSSNTSDIATGSGWSVWNARRSYNLLRLSLGHPMKHPRIEADANDEHMEIDDDLADDGSELSQRSGMEVGSPNIENLTKEVVGWASNGELEAECTSVSHGTACPEGTDADDTPNIESPTLGLQIAKSIPPALDMLPPVLHSRLQLLPPTHSHSPKAKDGNMECKHMLPFGLNSLPENGDVMEFGETVIPLDGKAGISPSLRSSRSLTSPSPRDRLAASLQKGLQILDNHQRSSLGTLTRSTNVPFSFQNLDLRKSKTSDNGVQAVPTLYPNCTCTCTSVPPRSSGIISTFQDSFPNKKARTMDAEVQTSPSKVLSASVELSNLLHVGCNTTLPDSLKNSLEMMGVFQSSNNLATIPNKPDYAQAIESLLAGSIRRERAAEEAMTQQAAEIEQLNRLVRQYKHERECNSMLQQSREDKIARLEALMAGVLPSETFLTEEWGALLREHKTLQEKFDKHPEVTHAKVEMERFLDELDRYKTFCDLGERDVLIQENMDLRNHLRTYLESGTPGAAKHWRFALASRAVHESLANLCFPPAAKTASDSVSEECLDKKWAEERQLLQEKELEWLSLMDEMVAESDILRLLAEKRKFELEGEKRCGKEMHEALEMAMEGHARLLEQYAELQEKHISLLGKNRKIREGVADLKKLAKEAGVTTTDTRWFECQAEQLVAMRIDHEVERDVAKDEVLGLQLQLQDTVEAVAAAGELLVRLGEAENAVEMAQDAAAMAGQEANMIRRDMEKLQKKHSLELEALQQQLHETRIQKSQLCPMCVMAERVKFEFTDTDIDTSHADSSKKYLRVVSLPGLLDGRNSRNRSMDGGGCAREDEDESVAEGLEDRHLFLENIDIDEFVDEPL